MCTGTLYWANIGRLVYGYEEAALLALTGDHPANPTINLPSRTVLAAGQKAVKVVGPFPETRGGAAGAAPDVLEAVRRRGARSFNRRRV